MFDKVKKPFVGLIIVLFFVFGYSRPANAFLSLGPILEVLTEMLTWIEKIHQLEGQVINTIENFEDLPLQALDYLKDLEEQFQQHIRQIDDRYRSVSIKLLNNYGKGSENPASSDLVPLFFNSTTGKWELSNGQQPTWDQVYYYTQILTGGIPPAHLKSLTESAGKTGEKAYRELLIQREELEKAILNSMKQEEQAEEYSNETSTIINELTGNVSTGKFFKLQSELLAVNNKLLAQQNKLLAQQIRLLSIIGSSQIKAREKTVADISKALKTLKRKNP